MRGCDESRRVVLVPRGDPVPARGAGLVSEGRVIALSQVRLFQSIAHPVTGEETYFIASRSGQDSLVATLHATHVEITLKGETMCTPLTNVRSFVVAPLADAKGVECSKCGSVAVLYFRGSTPLGCEVCLTNRAHGIVDPLCPTGECVEGTCRPEYHTAKRPRRARKPTEPKGRAMAERFMVCSDCLKKFFGGWEKSCSHGWDMLAGKPRIRACSKCGVMDELHCPDGPERAQADGS
jgi:hypothetical protein